ncbi:hypothetical protein MTO96_021748 [Rhipicephalus appendiculatus]
MTRSGNGKVAAAARYTVPCEPSPWNNSLNGSRSTQTGTARYPKVRQDFALPPRGSRCWHSGGMVSAATCSSEVASRSMLRSSENFEAIPPVSTKGAIVVGSSGWFEWVYWPLPQCSTSSIEECTPVGRGNAVRRLSMSRRWTLVARRRGPLGKVPSCAVILPGAWGLPKSGVVRPYRCASSSKGVFFRWRQDTG